MLNKLRNKKTAKKIWIGLAVIIIPPFVLWGSGSLMRSKQKTGYYVGRLFGRNITALEYQDALGAVKNQAIMQFGDKFSEVQKQLHLESQAWERLILLVEAKKYRISVSDKEVISLLERSPLFQNKGRFDNQIYSQILEYVFRTQARAYEEQTRQNIILSRLYRIITDNITVNEDEIKEEYRKLNEEVSISYIAGLSSEFAKGLTASDDDLKDYFAKNYLHFKQPLSFNIEYISLTDEEVDSSLKSIKDKIHTILTRLHRREDFSKIAKDYNASLKETGLFGQTDPIPGIGWSQEIFSVISKAKANDILPPLYIDKNYYILRIKERKEPYIPEFETIKNKVKDVLLKDKAQGAAKEKIESCFAKLKEMRQEDPKAIDFEKAAKDYGLKSGSSDLFKYGSYIEGIGASDNFFIQARVLQEGDFSPIIEASGAFYIIKLKTKKPIDEEKFKKKKNKLRKK